MIRMVRSLPRRQVLAALLAVPSMAALLAACSDSGDEAKAEDVKPADPATPAAPADPAKPAAQAPKPAGTVDMAKLLEPGMLPERRSASPTPR